MENVLKMLGYFALMLTTFGTIGNLIIAYVSFIARSDSTLVLFRYLALNNVLALYFWNINHFTVSNLNLNIQNYSIFSCKFGNWIQFSSLQSSAWLLVTFYFLYLYFLILILI